MNNSYDRINNISLMIIATIGLVGALIYTKAILVPFVISIFLFAIVSPVSALFEVRLKLSRWPSLVFTITLFLILSFILVFFVVNSIDNFLQGADLYREKLIHFITWSNTTLGKVGISLDLNVIKTELKELPVLLLTKQFSGGVLSLLGNITLIIIFSLFLIVGNRPTHENQFVLQIHYRISKYISTKFFTSFLTGFLTWLILALLRVDLAFMFGVLAFIFNFIPNFGSLIAVLLPLPIVLLKYSVGWKFYLALSLLGATQFIIGNILETKMMGKSMNLHPITILIFLMFWGMVWGIPGMFLAVPMTAILKIVLEHFDATRTFADLLEGKVPDVLKDSL